MAKFIYKRPRRVVQSPGIPTTPRAVPRRGSGSKRRGAQNARADGRTVVRPPPRNKIGDRIGIPRPSPNWRSTVEAVDSNPIASALGSLGPGAALIPGAWGHAWAAMFNALWARIVYADLEYSCGGPSGYFSNSQTSCGITVSHGTPVPPEPLGLAGSNKVFVAHPLPTRWDFEVVGLWHKADPWPFPVFGLPTGMTQASPHVEPRVPQWLDPEIAPGFGVPPDIAPTYPPYKHIPNVRENPNRVPGHRTEFGPRVYPRARPGEEVNPHDGYSNENNDVRERMDNEEQNKPDPQANTDGPVSVGTDFNWRTNPRRRSFSRPRDRPPTKREKERKGKATKAAISLLNVVGAIGEFVEAVRAVYAALPASVRRNDFFANGKRPLTITQMVQSMYRHHDQIDLNKAVRNLIWSQVQDAAVGRFVRAARKGNPGSYVDRYLQNFKGRGIINVVANSSGQP